MTNIVFKTKKFQSVVSKCNTVIDKKSTIPILNYILLEPSENKKCFFKATNLDTSVVMSMECESIEGNDKIAFPAGYMNDISRVAAGEEINLSFDSDQLLLEVTSGKSFYTIPCSSIDNFPEIPKMDRTETSFNISLITKPLKKLAFSTTDARMNKSYSGILIKNNSEGDLDMVSTDIHRISIVTLKGISFKENEHFKEGIVIPVDDFKRMSGIFEKDENVSVAIENEKFFVSSDNKVFISRLIKNDFPEYGKIVGSIDTLKNKDVASINKNVLEEGLKRVIALVTEEKIWPTKLKFSENILEMESKSGFGGISKDQILIEKAFDNSYEIGINSRFIIEVLGVMEKNEINLCSEEGLKPLTFFEDSDESSYIHMVMPLRM